MSCGCIKKRGFDIHVDNRGCTTMVLEDQSTWVGGSIPETYSVLVQIPSRNSDVQLDLKVNSRNLLTSKDLLQTAEEQCLPDDIYCFSTQTCGYTLKITRAFLCSTDTKIDKLIADFADDFSLEKQTIIQNLQFLSESVKINAEKDNEQLAKDLFKELKKQLKKFDCDDC